MIIVVVMSSQINGQSTRWRGQYWNTPVEIPPNASIEEKNRLESFNIELAIAKDAQNKKNPYAMTDHISKALKHRPVHRENILLEYKMAVALSQYGNAKYPITPARELEAMKLFKKIADTYHHMDYYSNSLTESQSIECPQNMVIRAANHFAASRLGSKDIKTAKIYATLALDCLAETYHKRVSYYLNKPEPKKRFMHSIHGSPEERHQWAVKKWKAMKERAQAGDVLGRDENLYVKLAVRKYGMSFGDNQNFGDVVASMTEVMKKYDGTPMANFAEEFLGRSKERMTKRMGGDIALGSDFKTVATAIPPTNDLPVGDEPLSLKKKENESEIATKDMVENNSESNISNSEKQNHTTIYIVVILVIVVVFFVIRRKR